jgi:multidrug efflux pump subunit AcrA (membrane-fusion protein)
LSALRDRVQKKSEVREEQAASVARARLVFETAVARVRQKNQEAEMAREVAEAALGEADAVERELRAAQSEFQQAEIKLRDLGIDAPREDFGISDVSLFRSVQGEILRAPPLSHVAISVEVKMGVVTLRGLVPDDHAGTLARNIAEGVKGVRRVENLLTLREKEDLWRGK